MASDHSLLAHLVPKLTRGVEDAATDALAFILNESKPCRDALVNMVSDGDRRLAPLYDVKTQVTIQVTESESRRLDLVAYDSDRSKRLIIESKFWAPLLDGQASVYVRHLADDGPAVLLFVAPEARHGTLWTKVERQFEDPPEPSDDLSGLKLRPACHEAKMIVADVVNTGKRVALMSWDTLLAGLTDADSSMDANLQQLHVLVHAQDEMAFAPLHAEDLDAMIPRRLSAFNRMVDGVADRGKLAGWISTKGLKAVSRRDGYLRYIGFDRADGSRMIELALRVSLPRWAELGATPLWLRIWRKQPINLMELRSRLDAAGWLPTQLEPDWLWVPIELPMGVEYEDVLESAAEQVKRVRDIVADLA